MKAGMAKAKRGRKRREAIPGVKLTKTELALCKAFRGRGTLDAAAEKAGISYARARQLMTRQSVKDYLATKKLSVGDLPPMTRKERLQYLSDLIRDPATTEKAKLQAMDLLCKMNSDYKQTIALEGGEKPLEQSHSLKLSLALEERIQQLGGV